MANFTLSNKPRPLYAGGPNGRCSICKFENPAYPWYVVFEGVVAEAPYPSFNGQMVEETVQICADHATELKSILDDIIPDTRLAKAQAATLKAEAARAKAERRADAAEKALHAMQDWQGEMPAVLSPGGK